MLLERGATIRSEAIRTQIKSVLTFCNLAEFEMQQQSMGEARTILSKIRTAMARIVHHLDEPGHVSAEANTELQDMAAKAQARVEQIENAMSGHS